jgi:ABC-type Fe3+-siderophore transport system permease subunit
MKETVFKHLFLLLVLFYLCAFETQLYNFNVGGLKDTIGIDTQNLFEAVTETFLVTYCIYVIYYINEFKYVFIRIFLTMLAILYFLDALASILVLLDDKNKIYSAFYDITFEGSFYFQNLQGLLAMYILYLLIFK